MPMLNKIKLNHRIRKTICASVFVILVILLQPSIGSSLLSYSKSISSAGSISNNPVFNNPIVLDNSTFLFSEDFENGLSSSWSYIQNINVQSAIFRSGDYSALLSNGGYGYVNVSEATLFVELSFFVSNLPESGLRIELLRLFDVNGDDIGVVHITNNKLYLYRVEPDVNGDYSQQILLENTWYTLGFQYTQNGYQIILNGIEVISDLVSTVKPIGAVLFGQFSSTDNLDLYLDDLVVTKDLPIPLKSVPDPVIPPIPLPPNSSETGLPWSIIGEDYLFYTNGDPDLIWTPTHLSKLVQWECNTMRISFSFADSTPNYAGDLSMSVYDEVKMDRTLDLLGSVGVKGILNLHNVNGDMYGDVGSWNWVNNWRRLAQIHLGDSRVVAFQIFNEPIPETWASSGPVGAITSPQKLVEAFAYVIDEIRSIDPSRTIVYPVWYGCGYDYPSMADWVNELQSYGVLSKGNIVYDIIHPYYFENSWDMGMTPTQKVDHYWDNYMIPAINLLGVENVWVGETFAWPEFNGGTHHLQIEFLTEMINKCVEYGVGVQVFSYYGISAWQDEGLAASNYLD
jgi:hypothetical protein